MSPKTTKPKIFSPASGGILDSMLKKASKLSNIDQIVTKELPKRARDHCAVGEYSNGILSLIIENGSWATAIRYQQNNLIKKLLGHPEFTTLTTIKIKTRPTAAPLQAENGQTNKPRTSEEDSRKRKTERLNDEEKGRAGRAESKAGQFEKITDPSLKESMQKLFHSIQSNKNRDP